MPRRIAFFDLDAECGPAPPADDTSARQPESVRCSSEHTDWSERPSNNGRRWTAPNYPAEGAGQFEARDGCVCPDCRRARLRTRLAAQPESRRDLAAGDRRNTLIAIAVAIVLALVASYLGGPP